MRQKQVFLGIIAFLILGLSNCVEPEAFPVKPTLFIDGIFEDAEGLAFNGEGDLFVTANKAFWSIDTNASVKKLAELHSNLGVAAIGDRDMLVADFGPTNRFAHGPNCDGIVWRITPEGEKTIAAKGNMGDPNFIVVRHDDSYLVSDDATCDIFQVSKDGVVSLFTDFIGHPNGMLLSQDGRTLYVAQIFSSLKPFVWDNRLWALQLDEKGNFSGEAKVIAEMKGEFAGLDGLAMDELGRLYVTLPRRGELWRVDPKTGKTLLVADGMLGIASIAFGRGAFDHHAIYGASTRRGEGQIWKIDVGVGGARLNR